MSHYTEIKVDFSQKSERELVAALEEQFGEGKVEVHENPTELFDWDGRKLSESNKNRDLWAPPCNIIVRRAVQSEKAGHRVLSNDAGYARTEDGKYKAYIDNAGFSEELQAKVCQSYVFKVAEKQLKREGYRVERLPQADGSIHLSAKIYA